MASRSSEKSMLGALFLTLMLDLLGFGMVVPLMPLYARQHAASGTQIGWLLASYSLMQLVFAPLWGALSDRLGRRPVLLVTIGGNAVALGLFACASNYISLLMSRTLAGFFAANLAVASAYIADCTPEKDRARRMGLVGAAFGIGFVAGPVLAAEISPYGHAWVGAVAALLSVVNLFWALFSLPESLDSGKREHPHVAAQLLNPWQLRRQAFAHMPQLRPLLLLIFAQVFGFALFEMALTLFVGEYFAYSPSDSGHLLAFVGLMLVIVQGAAIGPLTRRLGSLLIVPLALGAMGFGLLLVALSAGHSSAMLWSGLICAAWGQGLASPSLSALVTQRTATNRYGAGLGLSQSMSALARVLGPLTAGLLIDIWGTISPLVGGSLVLATSAVSANFLLQPPSTRPQGTGPQLKEPCS